MKTLSDSDLQSTTVTKKNSSFLIETVKESTPYSLLTQALADRSQKNNDIFPPIDISGLTFGTISALYGLSHGIVTQGQYSFLVATVIASAVIPTVIASIAFLPKHLLTDILPKKRTDQIASEAGIDEE